MSVLTMQHVTHTFGGLTAIQDFNLVAKPGEIVGVIGPNGAGKTTLFNLLCGVYPLQQGNVFLDQIQLNNLTINQIARCGIARTFQNIRLFKKLSVLENIKIAIQSQYSLINALTRQLSFRQAEQSINQQAWELLQRFHLERYAESCAQELPYGLQRLLEIARALATNPKVLLLDEPACGMNASEAQIMAQLIQQIQSERSLVILLIDHQMHFVMSLCQRIIVLNFGKTIAMGDPNYIRNHPEVIQSYLGAAC